MTRGNSSTNSARISGQKPTAATDETLKRYGSKLGDISSNQIQSSLSSTRSARTSPGRRTLLRYQRRCLTRPASVTYAALMSIEEVTKQVGIQPSKIVEGGEKWERDRLRQPLPSQLCRDLLDDAIRTLLGPKKDRRLVVFIDDLDRCTRPVAFRLLEALKIYLSIPSCVFVLGLDWRTIRQAVAAEMMKTEIDDKERRGDVVLLRADDYLDKLCQAVHRLPLMADAEPFLTDLTHSTEFEQPKEWVNQILQYNLLPANPRKIKSFVNGLIVYVGQLRKAVAGELDRDLALIVAYLKLYEDRVFRILESNVGFWDEIVRFCKTGASDPETGEARRDVHDVFQSRKLPDSPVFPDVPIEGEEFKPVHYQPLFPDPADERVFRAAKLIREWSKKTSLTNNLFRQYIQLRSK